MELVIERTSLQNSLAMVQGIVERRNTVPILGHVLIEPEGNKLKLSATDLEVGIRTEVACKASAKGSLTRKSTSFAFTARNVKMPIRNGCRWKRSVKLRLLQ